MAEGVGIKSVDGESDVGIGGVVVDVGEGEGALVVGAVLHEYLVVVAFDAGWLGEYGLRLWIYLPKYREVENQ